MEAGTHFCHEVLSREVLHMHVDSLASDCPPSDAYDNKQQVLVISSHCHGKIYHVTLVILDYTLVVWGRSQCSGPCSMTDAA